MSGGGFFQRGWARFERDPSLLDWLLQITPAALATRQDPDQIRNWLRGAGTWFVGVNALENDGQGVVQGSDPLTGAAVDFVRETLGFGNQDLDRAQVSICYPGFPGRMNKESDAAFRFRQTRDAAHVDGLHPSGPQRQRRLEEYSGFLLGIPVTKTDAGAAPLVVWEGSHRIMADMFHAVLADIDPADWSQVDMTKAYHTARALVFDRCPRVVVHAQPGEAYVLHRMALHGVSPWQKGAVAPPEGRAILYFRPEIAPLGWLFSD